MTEARGRVIRISFAVAMLLVDSMALAAQGGVLWIGAGAAVPRGGAGERYAPGPAVAMGVGTELNPRFAVRLDAEWSRIAGPTDLRTYGASLNGLLRFSDRPVLPYALAGFGAYRLQRIGEHPSVYGTTPAVQAGLGIEVEIWPTVGPFLEGRATVHLTDYASREFTASVLWPFVAGIRVPLRW